jgi:hypothetical protein
MSFNSEHRSRSTSPLGVTRRERRRSARATPHEPSRASLVSMIRASYHEMPGLALRLAEAARLFGLREATCRIVLDDLVKNGHLRYSEDGYYRAL